MSMMKRLIDAEIEQAESEFWFSDGSKEAEDTLIRRYEANFIKHENAVKWAADLRKARDDFNKVLA